MKLPASQFYWADWLRDPAVRASSLESRGLWIDMLAIMHAGTPRGTLTVSGKGIAPDTLARMVGISLAKCRRLLAELESNGVYSTSDAGVIYSRRMVRDEELRQKRGECGKLSLNHPAVPRPKDTIQSDGKDTIGGSIGGSPSVAVAVAVASSTTELQQQLPSTRGRKRRAPVVADRSTWLTPAAQKWEARHGAGTFPFGQAASLFAPLRKAGHTPDAIAAHLDFYLELRGDERGYDKAPEYRGSSTWAPNLKAFRDTFGKWNPKAAA